MKTDTKILIGSVIFTLALIVGFALISGRSSVGDDSINSTSLQNIDAVSVDPQKYDLGNVPINGGVVVKEYKVKNISAGVVKIKKISTSCMCTKAKVKVGDRETKFFGMEENGDKNPPVNLDLTSGEEALVTAIFDPAAHGPKGVGPIDRSIFLTFSDPAGIKELKFNGVVVN